MESPQYKLMSDVEDTHFWYKGMRLISQSILKTFITSGNKKVLDAGCGTGGNFNLLKQFGTVVGIDVSAIAIRLAKEKGIINIKKGSVDNIPFSTNSFDLITCFDVLGHKQVYENKALSEINRVLKPKGLILMRVAAYNWLYSIHDIRVQNIRRYTRNKIRKLFLENNLIPIKITYANTILFPLVAFKRLVFKMFKIRSLNSDVQPINYLLNIFLYIPFMIENFIIKYINLPFGSSIIILAKKK